MIVAVAIDPRARRAWPWVPTTAPVDAILIGPTGQTLRVLADGACEDLLEVPRRRSIAADPCATRRRAA